MLLLVDTFSLLYKLFYALPQLSYNDKVINSIYGIVKVSIKFTKDYRPDYFAFCIDKGRSGRQEIVKSYKANRRPTSDKFKQQIPIFFEFVNSANLKVFAIEEVEADDTIYTLSNFFKDQTEIYVLTSDKDLLQIVENKVSVLLMKKGITEIEFYDPKTFTKHYGFDSKYYPHYKALVGDNSDNIKGIKGIGQKKAIEIIQKLQQNVPIDELLDQNQIQIFMNNLEVIKLKNFSEQINIGLQDMKLDKLWYKRKEFIEFLKKYNFVSILNSIEDRQMRLF